MSCENAENKTGRGAPMLRQATDSTACEASSSHTSLHVAASTSTSLRSGRGSRLRALKKAANSTVQRSSSITARLCRPLLEVRLADCRK